MTRRYDVVQARPSFAKSAPRPCAETIVHQREWKKQNKTKRAGQPGIEPQWVNPLCTCRRGAVTAKPPSSHLLTSLTSDTAVTQWAASRRSVTHGPGWFSHTSVHRLIDRDLIHRPTDHPKAWTVNCVFLSFGKCRYERHAGLLDWKPRAGYI